MCTFTDYSGTSVSLALYISYLVFVFDDILVTVGIIGSAEALPILCVRYIR